MNARANTPVETVQQSEALFWFFPSTDHGEDQGFSDSQLEYFQGDHEKYIARETIQNAVDARLDYSKPVSVVFERLSIQTSELPGNEELLDRMRRCAAYSKGQEKAETFFSTAISLLRSKQLPVLRISDYNTKGLSGGDTDSSGNWYRLVRAAGTSSAKGVAGGSFGIGKGAPVAASSLRTVFYSSVNDRGELVCQGKARLVSHRNDDDDVRQGVGFYGVSGYKAIRDLARVPELFRRESRGTDVFIMGYQSGNGWQAKIVRSVLNNFWLAIYSGNLSVTIKETSDVVISKENLSRYIDEFGAEETRHFYQAFTSSGSSRFDGQLPSLGAVQLTVLKGDGFPSKIMMARSPKMLVQDKGYRVLREPYAGVFVCDNETGNELLRDLEPPAHDKWDPDRAPGGRMALRELESFVRESLRSLAETLSSAPEDIPGLDRYLPDREDRDYMPADATEAMDETELTRQDETAQEVGAERPNTTSAVESVTRSGIVTTKKAGKVRAKHPNGTGATTKPGRPTGPAGGDVDGVRINTSSVSFRSFVRRGDDERAYNVILHALEDCEGAIRLVSVGDDGDFPLEIHSVIDAESGTAIDARSSLIPGVKLKKGGVAKLIVRSSEALKCSIGLEAYGD